MKDAEESPKISPFCEYEFNKKLKPETSEKPPFHAKCGKYVRRYFTGKPLPRN